MDEKSIGSVIEALGKNLPMMGALAFVASDVLALGMVKVAYIWPGIVDLSTIKVLLAGVACSAPILALGTFLHAVVSVKQDYTKLSSALNDSVLYATGMHIAMGLLALGLLPLYHLCQKMGWQRSDIPDIFN